MPRPRPFRSIHFHALLKVQNYLLVSWRIHLLYLVRVLNPDLLIHFHLCSLVLNLLAHCLLIIRLDLEVWFPLLILVVCPSLRFRRIQVVCLCLRLLIL